MLLVGSRALTHYTCGGDDRPIRDTDFICTHDEAKEYIAKHNFQMVIPNEKGTTLACHGLDKPVELMIAWPGSTNEEILRLSEDRDFLEGQDEYKIASLNTLYLLKMSHRYLKNSPHFLKTMRDIQLMRLLGAEIEHPELLARREKETYDYAHPSLMRNKRNFFDPNEGVGYRYDHDTIHLAMAVDPLRPAYSNYQRDDAEVAVDRRKWDACSEEIKLNSVLEESLVLALERSQIPYRNQIPPERSFKMALMKVCTSIASGWWREYAWEHYDAVVDLFNRRESDKPYLLRFDEAVEAGIVRQLVGAHHE